MKYFRYVIYLLFSIAYSFASAGSFDLFFLALERNDTYQIKLLLKQGFDPNSVNVRGEYALIAALRSSSFDVARILIEIPGTDVNARTAKDETALMLAAIRGNLDICRQLIAHDADINKPGWTPLHYAATYDGDTRVLQLLLDHFAYIDAESPNGTTPLMMAAGYGSLDAVKLLLTMGADASLKNAQGLTAIDFARKADRPETVRWINQFVVSKQTGGDW